MQSVIIVLLSISSTGYNDEKNRFEKGKFPFIKI